MTEIEATLAERAMQAAEKFATLRRLNDEQTCDAVSYAWEFAQAGNGTPSTIAWYAIKRAISDPRASRSMRSVDSREFTLNAVDFDVNHYAVGDGNPATIAGFRIDFAEWRATLSSRLQAIADALASGETTQDVASRFHVSEGRISQIRRELETYYREMMSR